MIPSFENRHALGGRACPAFGGDSSSSAASSQTTNTSYSDSRSVIGIDDHSVSTALQNAFNTTTANTSTVHDAFNTQTSLDSAFNTTNTTGLTDAFNTDNSTHVKDAFNTTTNTNTNTSLKDAFNTNNSVNSVWTDSSVKNWTSTDAGAVKAGRDLGMAGIAQNATNFSTLLTTATNLFAAGQTTTAANLKLAGSLADGARGAYSDATAQSTGNKTLMLSALAVVAVVAAVVIFKK